MLIFITSLFSLSLSAFAATAALLPSSEAPHSQKQNIQTYALPVPFPRSEQLSLETVVFQEHMEDMRQFRNPEKWVHSLVAHAFKTTREDSCLHKIRSGVYRFTHNDGHDNYFIKLQQRPEEGTFSEGVQISLLLNCLGQYTVDLLNPVGRVFDVAALNICFYAQPTIVGQTLVSYWLTCLSKPEGTQALLSMIGCVATKTAALHARTFSAYRQAVDWTAFDLIQTRCLVHGDLHPGNIMIETHSDSEQPNIRFIDYVSAASCLETPGHPIEDIMYFFAIAFHYPEWVDCLKTKNWSTEYRCVFIDTFMDSYRNQIMNQANLLGEQLNKLGEQVTDFKSKLKNGLSTSLSHQLNKNEPNDGSPQTQYQRAMLDLWNHLKRSNQRPPLTHAALEHLAERLILSPRQPLRRLSTQRSPLPRSPSQMCAATFPC